MELAEATLRALNALRWNQECNFSIPRSCLCTHYRHSIINPHRSVMLARLQSALPRMQADPQTQRRHYKGPLCSMHPRALLECIK